VTSTTFFLPKILSKEISGIEAKTMGHWEDELKRVHGIAEPLARTLGLEILLIEQASEPGRKILRIILDKPGTPDGITVDDCADFSRALDPILDVEADVEGRYHLEVSSPGLDRPLVKPGHFRDHMGAVVHLVMNQPVAGRKNFKGVLEGVEGEGDEVFIILKVDQNEFRIPWKEIKRAHLDYFATKEINYAAP
jgi:ribosome maturation factor RimP